MFLVAKENVHADALVGRMTLFKTSSCLMNNKKRCWPVGKKYEYKSHQKRRFGVVQDL